MSSQRVRHVQPAPRTTSAPRLANCVLLLDREEICIPASAYTLEGFRAWGRSDDSPDRGQFTFVNGEILIDMSGEEIETHNKVKSAVSYGIMGINEKLDLGEFYSDRVQMSNVDADLCCQPDASLVLWESLEAGRVRMVPRENAEGQYVEVEGTLDWVVEIISRSSISKDTRRLRAAYHKAGITEYWLIDALGAEIEFQILLHEADGYVPAPKKGEWQQSKVFNRLFRLVRQTGRLGRWKYTLQSKSVR